MIPAGLMLYGISVWGDRGLYSSMDAYNDIQKNHAGFHSDADEWLRFGPLISLGGLKLAGLEGRNDLFNTSMITALSLGFSGILAGGGKAVIRQWRPDSSDRSSTPSGHSAVAFSSAHILFREYKNTSAWIGIAGYGMATGTAVYRLYNNEHWLSDVLIGAGVGIFATELAYHIYPWLHELLFTKRKLKAGIIPYYAPQNRGFSCVFSF